MRSKSLNCSNHHHHHICRLSWFVIALHTHGSAPATWELDTRHESASVQCQQNSAIIALSTIAFEKDWLSVTTSKHIWLAAQCSVGHTLPMRVCGRTLLKELSTQETWKKGWNEAWMPFLTQSENILKLTARPKTCSRRSSNGEQRDELSWTALWPRKSL